MISMCSPPRLLDGLTVNDRVKIFQIYNPNQVTASRFKYIKNSIIVLLFMEYHNNEWIDEVLSTGAMNNNYYIIIHSHDYPQWIRDTYKNHYTLILEPSLYTYYTDKFENIDFAPSDKKLHFLSLNNRASPDRQALYYFFKKFSLTDKSYFSYQGDLTRSKFSSLDDISKQCGQAWYLDNLDLSQLNNLIPVTIPGDSFNENDWSWGQSKYYQDTFCSLVFESYIAEDYPYFSEKIFKPIAFYHPFIVHGNPGSLGALRDLGFKTFGDYWDESYDQLRAEKRLESIFHLTLELANWSHEKINRVYNSIVPILKHNHNHFFNTLPKMFADRRSDLFNEIKTITDNHA